MHLPVLKVQEFHFPSNQLHIWVPIQQELQKTYDVHAGKECPFWAKVWPSALGMIQFLAENPHYYVGKEILEIAAGIGLPSFYVSSNATKVICSDYMEEAVQLMKKNIEYNQLKRITAMQLDWNDLPLALIPATVIMCDVNYDPKNFQILIQTIATILSKGSTILLATPQRLIARPFIEQLLNWSCQNEVISIGEAPDQTWINILVLKHTKE